MSEMGVVGFWGRLASAQLEGQFREESVTEDRKLGRFLSIVVVVTALLFVLNDWRLLGGTPDFPILMSARVVLLLVTAICFARLGRAVSGRQLDGWMLVWSLVVMFITLQVMATRPPYWMNHALTVLVIVSVAMLVPMRFSLQASCAVVFAIAAATLFLMKNPDRFLIWGNLTALTLAVVVGLIASWKLHHSRRESFLARQAQQETIAKLEAALAEVRNLQGILPICASCKKIRQEDGGWIGLEKYISERSAARFSHGLCPECKVRLYPEFTR